MQIFNCIFEKLSIRGVLEGVEKAAQEGSDAETAHFEILNSGIGNVSLAQLLRHQAFALFVHEKVYLIQIVS